MKALLKRLNACEKGLAAMEFALAAIFILVPLLFGSIEIGRYILFNQKLESVTAIAADAIARMDKEVATCADLGYGAYGAVMVWGMQPTYDFAANGTIIISAVEHRRFGPGDRRMRIVWQSKFPLGTNVLSRIGEVGTDPTGKPSWPSHFTPTAGSVFYDGDRAIVVEVFYKYEYFMDSFSFTDGLVYKNAIFRPRSGKLGQLQQNCGACMSNANWNACAP